MTTKLFRKLSKKYFFIFSTIALLGAVPYFAGSGLDQAEPLDNYLNNNFPDVLAEGLPYVPVFPNLIFDSPLTFNEVPNGNKIIVGQRDGRIYSFDKTANVASKNLMLDLSEKVGVVWDGGFLGLALHPEFGTNGNNYFYTWYTTEDVNSNDFPNRYTTQSCDSEEYWGNFLILARYTANPNTLTVQESSEQTLIKIRMYGTTHRGGGLLFGDDGFLYLTTGDQTAFKKAQDITNNIDGGVLRLDIDRDPAKSHPPVRTMPNDHGFSDEITGNGYYIPNDNPFLSAGGQTFEEYYSIGHRNPHRMTKDRQTGDLYVGEIGGGRHEEINVIKKGRNYGWPLYEGLVQDTFCVSQLLNNMAHERPLTAFPRSEANAVIGGFVYRGNQIPELQGKYICADYGVGEEIWSIDINTGSYTQLGNFTSTNIISFGEDKEGELYIMKQGSSTLYKMVSKDNPVSQMPPLLSQTGAFKNLNTLEPTDGLIPYDLVESFWSDGALKKRWVGIPNNGSHNTSVEKINYSADDVWQFPVGSVLIKHFELPINENNPSITKRLETRFSIKAANGKFYFVTYKWNNQGTDAEIIAGGLDETISITRANGSQSTQTWRYPSSADCITCHNSSSEGTLGMRSRYLNKEYTYPKTGRTANQLVTLSSLGILNQTITDANTANILTASSIDDPIASIDDKARSYMDLNCAYCHRSGSGVRGDFDLRLKLDIVQTNLYDAAAFNSLGIPNEKIVDPGNAATSILYHRVNSLDPNIKMPPVSKNKIDEKAIELLEDWINQLDPDPCADRIIMQTFDNIPGVTISELKNNQNYPNNPGNVQELNEFSIPINVADLYGVRVQGILKAPETGTYYFWVNGDDNVELNLSSDANAANKVRIAYHDGWTNPSQWNKYATQKSAAINLIAGQNYYIEALVNENFGGDNLAVGWRRPSNGNGSAPIQIIPCTVFDYFNGQPSTAVTGVTTDLSTMLLEEGVTQQIIATVAPSDATNQTVSWSSSNTNIATVTSDGLISAVSVGAATITVTTEDGGFEAVASITVSSSNNQNCTASGSILMERYDDISGHTIPALLAASNYPDTPSQTQELSLFEIQSNQGDNYGVRLSGTLCVPETGVYYFYIAGNNQVELNFSSTSSASDKTRIAYHEDWTGEREWDKVATQKSQGVLLNKGEVHYIEALMKEGGFGDNLAVGWRRPSDGNGSLAAEVIPGNVLSPSVRNVVSVNGITLATNTLNLPVGEETILGFTILPSNATNTRVSWTSSNTNIATVTSDGLVRSISEGTVTITVTTDEGGFEAISNITLTPGSNQSCTASGSILMERYDDISGHTIPALLAASNYPDTPSQTQELSLFEIQSNQGDNYGMRLSGTLCVPETGIYYFYIAGNNHVELNLGSSSSSIDKTRIAYHEDWTGEREWNKMATQKSQGIVLNKGEVRYIEALMKEGGFGDNLAVGWRRPSDGNGSLAAEVIPGNVLSPAMRNEVSVNGITMSTNTLNLPENEEAILTYVITPSNATNTRVSWTSSNTNIATVTSDGLVRAISEGSTAIAVTTDDGGFEAIANITVTPSNNQNCSASGSILMERYDDIGGYTISALLSGTIYPDNPSATEQLSLFEIEANQGDNYGVRVSGTLCVPETGVYYFYIAGNNHVELNLSSSESPLDRTRIAYHEDWTGEREWDKVATQKSQGIVLNKGEVRYIEALMKEGGFGDNLAVGWRRPSDGNGSLATEVIPGNVLSPRTNATVGLRAYIAPSSSLELSPVPASDILNIEYFIANESESEVELTIYDNLGRQMKQVIFSEATFNDQIDVSQLQIGTYILQIVKDDEIIVKRFIIMR